MKQGKLCLLVFLLLLSKSFAQYQSALNSSEIYQKIQQLNVLGSVLYIAAHPDDENTALISYFANHKKVQTAYLSLTRGDGGQNLIGPELREKLGLIRTQELIAARSIDGGQQFFSRANDFGYSKTPEETFSFWNKPEILHDVVLAIRRFKPDIIINRFDHRTSGTTHGHHTASAILSLEAVKKAADPHYKLKSSFNFPTWHVKRVFFNTSWWFYGSQEKFDAADKSNMIKLDKGLYSSITGKSNTEIASQSRSQHKSQGFGNTPIRGQQPEYLELVYGKPLQSNDIFEDINTHWSGLENGKSVQKQLDKIIQNYDFTAPEKSIEALIDLRKKIKTVKNKHWKDIKLKALDNIIAACAGLYLENVTQKALATPQDKLNLRFEVTQRSGSPLTLEKFWIKGLGVNQTLNHQLSTNQPFHTTVSAKIPAKTAYSNPYWLNKKPSLGLYKVPNDSLIGLPETNAAFEVTYQFKIKQETIQYKVPVLYKYNDPIAGEVFEPFYVVPPISIGLPNKQLIFAENTPKDIQVELKAFRKDITGELIFDLPENWKYTSENKNLHFKEKGEIKTVKLRVFPPKHSAQAQLKISFKHQNKNYPYTVSFIDYPHIPKQVLLEPAELKLNRLDLKTKAEKIAYLVGAGDAVPEALKVMNYKVDLLHLDQLTSAQKLEQYDAILLGIRAFNVLPELKFKNYWLFDYVKNGGNLIVQYNTSRGLVTEELAPYPLQLSRDRVTDENAKVTFIDKNHPVLNTPNVLEKSDFDNWVQERGLYFPNTWSDRFTPILSMGDPNESQTQGALLVAPYGKGYYIYTGLSLFRELPAGVPGAYRLLANLIALENEEN
ncbi:PIG-L family deacetylase [uncultured Mesonia sp.]|uniref:PIG-L family deacetylase n=1 Tax=uncultured Mesonia sp. TaxID=399731 RepID=UPI00374EFB78